MKKVLILLLAFLMVLSLNVSAQSDIKVILNGAEVKFDQPPVIINDRTMVPMRAIYEAFGAVVEWDAANRTAIGTKSGVSVSFTIGESFMRINDSIIEIDSPATILNGRTLVPVRALADAFNINVEWDATNRVVLLTKYESDVEESVAGKRPTNLSGSCLLLNNVSSTVQNLKVNLTSDTVTDFSSVSVTRYGSNLLDLSGVSTVAFSVNNDGTYTISKTKNDAGNDRNGSAKFSISIPAGTPVYASAECVESTLNDGKAHIIYNFADGTYLSSVLASSKGHTPTVQTFAKDVVSVHIMVIMSANDHGQYLTFKNPQLNINGKYDYADYIEPQTVTAQADGTVLGLTAISPITTLITNNSDVTINCTYDKEVGDYDLYGKTIVNFGDSIIGNYSYPTDVSSYLAEYTNATTYNVGFGGSRMSAHANFFDSFSMYNLANSIANNDWTMQENSMKTYTGNIPAKYESHLEVLKSIDFNDVDIITISFGTNDFTAGNALENNKNSKDTNSYAGALRYSIEKILSKYPDIEIVITTPIYRYWLDDNDEFLYDSDTRVLNGVKLTDFVAKVKEVANEYDLLVIDNYNDSGINKQTISEDFNIGDGTHPNLNGRKKIASNMAKKLFVNINKFEKVEDNRNPYSKIKSIAHASFGNTPTNTIHAYEAAVSQGFEYIECDVNFTSDGVAVLNHHNNINDRARYSDGSELSENVNINDITYQKALTYDFGIYKGEKFAGTKIVTFDEYMSFCNQNNLKAYVELYRTGNFNTVIEIMEKYNMIDKTTIISFYPDTLRAIKNINSEIRLGYLLDKKEVSEITSKHIETCKELMTGNNEVFIISSVYNSNSIAVCKEAGIPLEVWTLNNVEKIKSLDPYISGVTSDFYHADRILYYDEAEGEYEIVTEIDVNTLKLKRALHNNCDYYEDYSSAHRSRIAYTDFIPVEQNYIYKIEFTSTIDAIQVGAYYYTEKHVAQLSNKEALSTGLLDTGWQDSGYEASLAALLKGEEYKLMRFQFQINSGIIATENFITSVTISRKRVQ